MPKPLYNPTTEKFNPSTIYRDAEGRMHRDEGPAYIERGQKTGRVWRVVYYQHGMRHREEGPAVIWYGDEGYVTHMEYWEEGRWIRSHRPLVKIFPGDTREDGSAKELRYDDGSV